MMLNGIPSRRSLDRPVPLTAFECGFRFWNGIQAFESKGASGPSSLTIYLLAKGMPALDAGLLAAAQAVEHYEMSRYGTLRTWAEELGIPDACRRRLTKRKRSTPLLPSLPKLSSISKPKSNWQPEQYDTVAAGKGWPKGVFPFETALAEFSGFALIKPVRSLRPYRYTPSNRSTIFHRRELSHSTCMQ